MNKVTCDICGIKRETEIKRYGKFQGDVCKKCQDDTTLTRQCLYSSTDKYLNKNLEFQRISGKFGECVVSPLESTYYNNLTSLV
ncbi:MAG: hypothetical protein RLY43_138 [Bacteroidota bacterium]|jgi:hypothetical protein